MILPNNKNEPLELCCIISSNALIFQRQRTVYRLTLVKAWNVEEMQAYSELIALGQPDFIEVKVGLSSFLSFSCNKYSILVSYCISFLLPCCFNSFSFIQSWCLPVQELPNRKSFFIYSRLMSLLISVWPNLPTRFHLMLWQVLINLNCDTIPFSPPAVKCVFHQASWILGWLKNSCVKKLTLVLNPDPCFSPVHQLFITNIVSSSFKQPVNEMRLSNRWSYKSGLWVENWSFIHGLQGW